MNGNCWAYVLHSRILPIVVTLAFFALFFTNSSYSRMPLTVSKLADRIAVLYGGKILELGPTQAVLSNPRHPYTRALIRAYPVPA